MADSQALQDNQECHFWKLPQEIQDMVFEMAYGIKSAYKLRAKREYKSENQSWARTIFVPRTFAGSKANDFLVCKVWFIAAAKAWIRAQQIGSGNSALLSSKLAAAFAQDVDLSGSTFRSYIQLFRSYQSLRRLQITLVPNHFDINGKCPWTTLFTHAEFGQGGIASDLITLRGLHDFQLNEASMEIRETKVAEEKEIWRTNATAFESYVRLFVLTPKENAHVRPNAVMVSAPKPLYFGSRVCYDSSRLLPACGYEAYSTDSTIFAPKDDSFQFAGSGSRLEPNAAIANEELNMAPPQTADELVERLKVTPAQLWTWVQNAKKVFGALPSKI